LGHSRGAVAALYYALERGGAKNERRALVLNSGAYPPELVARAADLNVPTLILHGTADNLSPEDGGSEMTAVVRAREFEAALLQGKKVVESEYFEGAGHNALFTDGRQRERSIQRVADFLRGQGFE
jgi:alpha-beta hydrolase superfamily lysophospholipase